MNIFINADNYKEIALKTEKELMIYANELDIAVVEDIGEADIIFSIGGDGTFLKTSRLTDKPIIGINTGTLGYLTEIKPDDLKSALEDMLNGNYYIEERMMLEGEVIKSKGDVIKIPESLNEIAISKDVTGIVRFDAIVNDKLINSYRHIDLHSDRFNCI